MKIKDIGHANELVVTRTDLINSLNVFKKHKNKWSYVSVYEKKIFNSIGRVGFQMSIPMLILAIETQIGSIEDELRKLGVKT